MTVAGLPLTDARTLTLAGVVLAAAAGWIALWLLHGDPAFALATIAELCGQIGTGAGLAIYPGVLAMWLLMAVAMMLPTAMPAIDLYARLSRRMEGGPGPRIALFVAGYLVAWGGFGAVAALGQVGLAMVPGDAVPAIVAAGIVLVLAGLYQISAMKRRCLDLCRNPMLFFMSRWTESHIGTLRLGISHGAICVGCCAGLMALMFVTGAMNLVWMAILGLAMLGEKLLPGATRWSRPAGGLMIAAGAVSIASTLL